MASGALHLYVDPMKLAYLGALALSCLAPPGAVGQEPPDITGQWQAETPDGPQVVTVRPDSTASFGEESVRWRVAADTIFILFGDEWVGYNFLLEGDALTLSGGDLMDPITLTRVGDVPEGGGGRPVWRGALVRRDRTWK